MELAGEIALVIIALIISVFINGSISEGDFVTGVTTGSEGEATYGLIFFPIFVAGSLAGFWTSNLTLGIGLGVVSFFHAIILVYNIRQDGTAQWFWAMIQSVIIYCCVTGGLGTILFRELGWVPAMLSGITSVIAVCIFYKIGVKVTAH